MRPREGDFSLVENRRSTDFAESIDRATEGMRCVGGDERLGDVVEGDHVKLGTVAAGRRSQPLRP